MRKTKLTWIGSTASAVIARGEPSLLLAAVAALSVACGGASLQPATAPGVATQPAPTGSLEPTASAASSAATSAPPPVSVTPPAPAKPPIDATRVAALTGGKPETIEDVVKVSFPREDVKVEVDGWAKMPPFMGLTSWAAFAPGEQPGVEAMVMGDLVLFEDEVSAVMSAALDSGLEVTALHNHFFFDKPHVYFMHIGGEGSLDQLGRGVRAALEAEHAVRGRTSQPRSAFGRPPPAGKSKIDGAKLDTVLGIKGLSKDGMYKATMGRKTQAECGCTIGKAMGVNTWAAFAGTDGDAVVDGDFAVSEDELAPVLKALRAGAIDVVAIHSHMTKESPRILFLHYWGRGKATDLAAVVKRALDLTAWDGKAQVTT